MMKKRGLLLIALSMFMGVGAAWVANNWVQIQNGEIAENKNQVTVVTAAINIPYGTKLTERHISTITIPKEIRPQGSISDPAEVEGYVALSEIMAGEMLMKSRLSSHEGGSTLAALIGENMRAITLRVDDVVGVAGFLLPGNYVDVLATKIERRTKQASTDTVLTKIRVLAVDQKARTDDNDPVVVRSVTLEMTPKESEILAKSRAEGTIQLTLRNPNEEDVVIAEEPKPAPKKKVVRRVYQPPAPEVTVIRGTQVNKQKTKG